MMVKTQHREEKSRQKLAAEKMTPVQNLVRSLQSGQLKSELRTVQESIHAARALAMQIESVSTNYGLSKKYAEDFHVSIAYMTPDLSTLYTWPYEPGKEAEIQQRLSGPGTCCIPVGLVFGVRDRKQGGGWLSGARPFLNTPLVRLALQQRLEENTIGIH
ncbi:MAG TPA: hypothetical protein VFA74_16450 [Terriglobales bacterium]|nr:hypothetical protein [Terriglobales bacterium]